MNKNSVDEMEQIQKGLEEFLEKEVAGYREMEEEEHRQEYRQDRSGTRELKTDLLGEDYVQDAEYDIRAEDELSAERMERTGRTEREKAAGRRSTAKGSAAGREGAAQGNPSRSGKKQTEEEPVTSKKKKRKKKKSVLKRLLVTLLILCILVGGLWYFAVNRLYSEMQYDGIASLASEPMKEEGVINILLIGNDSREQGTDGRSDAMILLSISNQTKTIHLTSLLRDMYVEIPGYKDNRLNAAYAYGGPELLMETLEKNLDISVNRYVLVNFQAFANLVDAVGGVDLELTNDEVRYVNGFLVEYNILEGNPEGTNYLPEDLSGMVHLNGPQALSYCRNRLLGTDFGRTERQRKVLSAIIKKAPASLLTNPGELFEGLLPNLTTNLTEAECRNLSLQAGKLLSYDIVQASIPIEGSYSNATIRDMAVLEVDFEKNKEYIRTNIYGE